MVVVVLVVAAVAGGEGGGDRTFSISPPSSTTNTANTATTTRASPTALEGLAISPHKQEGVEGEGGEGGARESSSEEKRIGGVGPSSPSPGTTRASPSPFLTAGGQDDSLDRVKSEQPGEGEEGGEEEQEQRRQEQAREEEQQRLLVVQQQKQKKRAARKALGLQVKFVDYHHPHTTAARTSAVTSDLAKVSSFSFLFFVLFFVKVTNIHHFSFFCIFFLYINQHISIDHPFIHNHNPNPWQVRMFLMEDEPTRVRMEDRWCEDRSDFHPMYVHQENST